MKENKFIIGEIVTCIKNDHTNDKLITAGKEYKILEIIKNYNSVSIITDPDIKCYIVFKDFFISKRILRKNKLNKLNNIFN